MNLFRRSGQSDERQKQPKREGKSRFRRVNDWLHLWLGLISGTIVFVVCLMGCVWVFNEEITSILDPETNIEIRQQPVIPPSVVRQTAEKAYPGEEISYANYQQGKVVRVGIGDYDADHYILFLDPYTGKIIANKKMAKDETDFWGWVLDGHRFLWLPWKIGRPIVNYATLVFVVLLITGLIWWYPKKWTQSTRDKSFKIKWNGSFKRVNLDLHNVLGFYAMIFLLALALTGMVYGIEWYSKGLYWITSGGETLVGRNKLESDSLQAGKLYNSSEAMDAAWAKVIKDHPDTKGFYYNFPDTTIAKSTISITVYPSAGQFYNNQRYNFDRHTLKALSSKNIYDTEFSEAPFGTKLRRMNYDIHVGSILGFPGKVLAFLVTLIGASLPVTGFIIWWNRKGFGKGKDVGQRRKGMGSVGKNDMGQRATVKKPVFRPKTQKPGVSASMSFTGLDNSNS